MYKASEGTRPVGIYNYKGRKSCLKLCPEAPGVEVATRRFYEAFISYEDVPIPRSQVILMNGQCFLASEFIDGRPLRSFLESRQSEPDQYVLETASFQRLVIFCMMINPEDCRLENCLVRKKPNGLYEIVLIDNERSLGKEFVYGEVATRVHCVLFCFYNMLLQPVDIQLHAIEAGEDARLRLSSIDDEHLYQLALCKQCRKGERRTILGIPLGQEFVKNLNKKFDAITKIIHEGGEFGNYSW